MAERIRFPFVTSAPGAPAETSQIIDVVTNAINFAQGGPAAYTSILPWKLDEARRETPFIDVVLEFTGSGPITIGSGAVVQQIGLFGVIGDLTTGAKFLLGVLGMTMGNLAPQIPIISSAIGYAQKVCDVSAYDGLAIGGIHGVVTFTGADPTVTVRARPIRRRSYGG